MRILVISHNVFSTTNNMGRTLKAYFGECGDIELAQFYIHSEIPTDTICKNYYRITDKEMIRSIFTRKSGRVFGEKDIAGDVINPRTDRGNTAKLYQFARRRTPLIYFLRNVWWALGVWKTKKLLAWLDEFQPDAVFFASGDYAFMYKIARDIARDRNIPLAVSCVDDYYINNKNAGRFGGKMLHRAFMAQVKKTMERSGCIFTICDKMKTDYTKLFGKPCYTLCTPTSIREPLGGNKTNALSYMGNLGYNRNEQIAAMGRALRNINVPGKPKHIDVYSTERNPEKLKCLTEENGIRFHGAISGEEVLRVMGESLAVIHTESFDENIRKSIAYSVSTKIADSLASGTCILAYGPDDVASMEHLISNEAAFCITKEEDLERGLADFLENPGKREECISNALRLSGEKHDPARNSRMIQNVLRELCRE